MRFEAKVTAEPGSDVVDIEVLTIEYQAWKHAWESFGWPTKKA